MRFDAQYVLERLDTMGVFTFQAGEAHRVVTFMYEQHLGIDESLHETATKLFSLVAEESRREG